MTEASLYAGLLRLTARFLSEGGSTAQVERVLARIQATLVEGHSFAAPKGHATSAPDQTGDAAGQSKDAQPGHDVCAPASPPKSGRHPHPADPGQADRAPERGAGHSAPAKPATVDRARPSRTDRNALVAARQGAAASIFDRMLGGTGGRLGDLTKFQIRQIVRRGMIDVQIGTRLLREIPWPDDQKTPLEACATDEQITRIVQSADGLIEALNGGPHG